MPEEKPFKLLSDRLSELLEDELGIYRHEESGLEYPAIRVIPPAPPDSFVPESGIACAIWETPERDRSSQGGGGMSDVYWKVYLAQRDLDQSIDRAIHLIQLAFTGAKSSTAMQEKKANTILYERSIVTIPEWDAFDSDWVKGKVAWAKTQLTDSP